MTDDVSTNVTLQDVMSFASDEKKDKEYYNNLFQLYSQLFFSGNVPLLSEVYNALNKDPYNHVAYFFGGLALVSFKEYWNSMSLFRSACDLDPQNYIYAKTASIVANYIGNEADHIFYEKMSLSTNLVTHSPILDFLEDRLGNDKEFIDMITQGNKAYTEENFIDALHKYSEAVSKRFVNLVALRRIITVLMILGRQHEALGFARGIIEADEAYPEDFVFIADILARTGEFKLAEDYYSKAESLLLDVSLAKSHELQSLYHNPDNTYDDVMKGERDILKKIKTFLGGRYQKLSFAHDFAPKNDIKRKIGFVSKRFIKGVGMDAILNFIPSLVADDLTVVCFNAGFKRHSVEGVYRSFDVDMINLSQDVEEDVHTIRKHQLDIIVDLDGYAFNGSTDIFLYELAPVSLRYLGLGSCLKNDGGSFDKLLSGGYAYGQKVKSDDIVSLLPYSIVPRIHMMDGEDVVLNKKKSIAKGALIGVSLYEHELSPTILKKLKVVLDANKDSKIVLFSQKMGGYLSFLKLDVVLQKMGLSGRVIPSSLTEGHAFSYGEYINEIDMLIDFSMGNAFDEAYYALLAYKPVLSVRGSLPSRGEVAGLLTSLGLDQYIYNKDDQLIEAVINILTQKDKYLEIKDTVVYALECKKKEDDSLLKEHIHVLLGRGE